ncbi:MAG: dihydroxyacetone kinase subunit DhaL [Sphaerochaetaceae bacterium]
MGFVEANGQIIVEKLAQMIHENRTYLSEIDGAIGDGDHGINMDKGFSMAAQQLKNKELGLSEALKVLGNVLLEEIGGSMGPLYGTFFRRMARVAKTKEQIDAVVFEEMLQQGLEGLQSIGNAKVGDKTLLDTLVPALDALREANQVKKQFKEALNAMVVAAKNGMDSTVEMVAKVGRASRLGERSRGVLDAGATSCYLILKTMAEEMINLESLQ